MNELFKRTLTAGILALLVLFLILKSKIYFILFIITMVAIGMYEFFKLTNASFANKISSIALITSFIALMPIFISINSKALTFILIIVCLWWLNNFWMVLRYPKSKPYHLFTFIHTTLLFIPLFILTLLDSYWVLLLFLIVWCVDSFSYFSGKAFGRHKLAPKLSSGKTIEGAIGGLIATLFTTGIWMFFTDNLDWKFLLVTLVTVIFSIVGDLYESIYKREIGVKDSGRLLPGHGGVLDRIDGLLAATPVFTLMILLTFPIKDVLL